MLLLPLASTLLALLALGAMANETPTSSWLRHCERETPIPVEGVLEGEVPTWLEGRLTRVGPGMRHVGNTSYRHVFDALALLHLVSIQDGKVTYTSRFLESDAYKINTAAQRIVLGGFWSPPFPDPHQTVWDEVVSWFSPVPIAMDNCLVNVLQATDQMIAMTETDEVRVVNPKNLDTLGDKIKISKYVAIQQASAHPHVSPDGTVYNLASSPARDNPGAGYSIISLPKGRIQDAKVETTISARWRFHPGYMHSFAITDNYFILIESPFTISIGGLLKSYLFHKSLDEAMVWYPNENVRFRVIDRRTGQEHPTIFTSDAFVTFHHINAFETDNNVLVIDVSAISSGEVIKSLYYANLKKDNSDPTKLKYDSIAKRFVLPLSDVAQMPEDTELLKGIPEAKLDDSTGHSASAKKIDNQTIHLQGLTLHPTFFEMPRINYAYNGKPYRYAYGVNNEGKTLDLTALVKLDVKTGKRKVWRDPDYIVSEPVFVPSPESESSGLEDDGVVLSLLLHSRKPRLISLLVLNAQNFTQMAKVEFEIQGTAMPTFHGQFVSSVDKIHGY